MPKKTLLLALALLISLTLASAGFGSDIVRTGLNPIVKKNPDAPRYKDLHMIPLIDVSQMESPTTFKAPAYSECYRQEYNCGVAYQWSLPDQYGDDYFNMRMSVAGPETLAAVGIALYDAATVGSPDLDVFVWNDDGTGFPDLSAVIFQTTIPHAGLVYYPNYNEVDLSGHDIVLRNDFHVGWSTGDANPGDTLGGLSDDGSCGAFRSSVYWIDTWYSMLDSWGIDFNLLIYADMCKDEFSECLTVYDYCNMLYFWRLPDVYGDVGSYQKVSPLAGNCRLEEVRVMLYNNGDPDLYTANSEIQVWAGDGPDGLPGTKLGGIIITPPEYVLYPGWTEVDFSGLGIAFSDDIWIGIESFGTENSGGIRTLSDDGTCGSRRSCEQWAGNFGYMDDEWGLDVNFVMEAEICCAALVTIDMVHDSAYAWNDGRTLIVEGEYTNSEAKKFVIDHEQYVLDQVMPPKSAIFAEGLAIPNDYFGGEVNLTGSIDSIVVMQYPHPEDSILIYFQITGYDLIKKGNYDFSEPDVSLEKTPNNSLDESLAPVACRYAILISGGVNAGNNHPRYWNMLELYYTTLTTTYQYDAQNVHVIYFQGNSEDVSTVPAARVSIATEANIATVVDNVVADINANCGNSVVTAFILTYNHGADNGDLCLLGWDGSASPSRPIGISPGDFRQQVEKLVDAGCDSLFVSMAQCYGGQQSLELKNVSVTNDATRMYVSSCANQHVTGVSRVTPLPTGHVYLEEIIAQLNAGNRFEVAMREAIDDYHTFLVNKGYTTQADAGSTTWKRDWFINYGEDATVASFPDGKFECRFSQRPSASPPPTYSCLNTHYWEQNTAGSWVLERVWNFNYPGSGNELRILNVDGTSTGIFKLVSHSGPQRMFTITTSSMADRAHSWKDPPETKNWEDPSNMEDFAGFALGWDDDSSDEFGEPMGQKQIITGINQIGFCLCDMPGRLGPPDAMIMEAEFTIPDYNPYWTDMELILDVAEVNEPGNMVVFVSGPIKNFDTVFIDHAGRFEIYLGRIDPEPTQMITFQSMGADFTIDWWGLNTLVHWIDTSFVCGDANGDGEVNVGDAVFTINYIFNGGPAPDPIEAADANGDGEVNVGDAVYTINYVFNGGPEPICP